MHEKPGIKTPVDQKNLIILTPCTSTQRKLENEQRKSYRILISSCWPTDMRLFDFHKKRGLGPDQSHYIQSRLWSRLHTTPAQITRITRKWIYTEYTVLKIFSPIRIFEQLALALNNRVCPEIFRCIEIFFIIQDFSATCVFPENKVCPAIFSNRGAAAPPPPRTPMNVSNA